MTRIALLSKVEGEMRLVGRRIWAIIWVSINDAWYHMAGCQNEDEYQTGINNQGCIITAPFQLRKRGVETKLIIGGSHAELDQVLIRNIARAYQWYQAIKRGTNIDQIADQENISGARIRQMINHAFIAPEFVNLILNGKQPVGLTSNYLQRNALPSDWQKQRDLLSRL